MFKVMMFIIIVYSLLHPALSTNMTKNTDSEIAKILTSSIKANTSDLTDEMMLDYAYGNETETTDTSSIDTGLLEAENLKEIVAIATRKTKTEAYSREAYYGGSQYMDIAMDLMKQSVYATRYRLEATRPYRVQYGANPVYQIAVLYGSLMQLRLKMDSLFNTMYRFNYRTKFIWYLVIYERLVVLNVDVQAMVDRIFELKREMSKDDDDDYNFATTMEGFPV